MKDTREFIEKLESEGELKSVKAEVDWNLEIGAISRRGIDLRGPAILFENIKGYPKGYRVLANIMTASKPNLQARVALGIGLPKDTPTLNIIDHYAERMSRKPIKPKIVKTGPCKENILKGKDVDLFIFPTPIIHGIDGGRYIGTWHADVTKDPDSDWVNWGMYRHVIHNKNTLGTYMSYSCHGMNHFWKNEARGEDTPTAIAIGMDPISSLVATTDAPAGVIEVDMAGAINGEPIELVKCETVDLHVPATSEIVIEGMMRANKLTDEGPFGEYTGYSAGARLPRQYIDVTCITFRNDPILTITNMGKPYEEYNTITSITTSAQIANDLRIRGIPFKAIYSPVNFSGIVISAKMKYPGFANVLASGVWSSRAGAWCTYLILVGEDIDPTNMEDVMWCLCSRMHPKNGIIVIPDAPADSLQAYLTPAERKGTDYFTGYHVLFNATFPMEWPKEETPVIMDWENGWPPEIREKVISRWKELGLE